VAHRILRLALRAEEAGAAGERLDGALAGLSAGMALQRLRQSLARQDTGRDGVIRVLAACRQLGQAPDAVAAQAVAEAPAQPAEMAEALHRLADALRAAPGFFSGQTTRTH
jgi:predicted translin family RNA/ssDNA-binding protein